MIQKEINKKMPLKKNIIAGDIFIEEGIVKINNDIEISLKGHSVFMDKNIPFDANTKGELTYKEGRFYFKPYTFNVDLEKIE